MSQRLPPTSAKMRVLGGFSVKTKAELTKTLLDKIPEDSDQDGPPSLDYNQESPIRTVQASRNKSFLNGTIQPWSKDKSPTNLFVKDIKRVFPKSFTLDNPPHTGP